MSRLRHLIQPTPVLGARAVACIGLAAACGGSPTEEPFVRWEGCPILHGTNGDQRAECATVRLPLSYAAPDGEQIGVFVKRVPRENASSQLWLLMGEPGNPATDFEPFARRFGERANADVYMVDHRGVGRSQPRLSCPEQERADSEDGAFITATEMPDCAAHITATYGDAIYEYTVTAAARDLGEIISHTREAGKKTLIYAVSYGTYWAHRYLQQFPDQVDGLFLDSVLSPAEPGHEHMPFGRLEAADEVGRTYFDACGQDAFCSSKLGTDPNAVTTELYAKLAAGFCPAAAAAGLGQRELKGLLGFLVGQVTFRPAATALVHRLNRCSNADVAAIEFMMANWFVGPFGGVDADLYSWIVSAHVERSEMWSGGDVSFDDFITRFDGFLYAEYPSPKLFQSWTQYPFVSPKDEFFGGVADVDVPVIMTSGTMDASIPPAEGQRLGEAWVGANQHWLILPRASHISLSRSPIESDETRTCGWILAEQFFANPEAPLETSCMEQIVPLRFVGEPSLARTIFNADDLYD